MVKPSTLNQVNEAAAFRKTYDHIISRLKDEKRHFDMQLSGAIETLKAKENDLKELIQMSTGECPKP
jgi:hypothetical protein